MDLNLLRNLSMDKWGEHIYCVGNESNLGVENPDESLENIKRQKKDIEPWLAAIFQSEHLALLLGNGFSRAIANHAGLAGPGMGSDFNLCSLSKELKAAAKKTAISMRRVQANIEDQIRVANELIQGLKILGDKRHLTLESEFRDLLKKFIGEIYKSERDLKSVLEECAKPDPTKASKWGIDGNSKVDIDPLVVLVSFLLSFSSRTATRERLHIFTTNYDRLIEYGADFAGLQLLDRFVGYLEPIFRSSRLEIDMHYNPPGIRGEPRYLEGVARFTKLHGSLDWISQNDTVKRTGLPFGPREGWPMIGEHPEDSVLIYPNPAKDRGTAEYPYVDLFRDYAAAVCRPNSALVTFGYGFGDEHINRVIADMLTIPSTHLVIISHDSKVGQIRTFYEKVGRKAQISLLLGPHFGDMPTLVENYLPKPAIDHITIRKTELLRNRGLSPHPLEECNQSQEGQEAKVGKEGKEGNE